MVGCDAGSTGEPDAIRPVKKALLGAGLKRPSRAGRRLRAPGLLWVWAPRRTRTLPRTSGGPSWPRLSVQPDHGLVLPCVPEPVVLSRDLEDADPVQSELVAVRHAELHEGPRPEDARHDDPVRSGRAGFVQLKTKSPHGVNCGTLQLQQNADIAIRCRPTPLDRQEVTR